ncbi:MAG: cytochrome c3 family protein [archaeon]
MNKVILTFVLVIASSVFYAKTDECYNCHNALGDNPSGKFTDDVHFKKGISCAGCHGGNDQSDDMEAAMNKTKGFIAVPKGDLKTGVCIRCHSDEKKMKSFGSSLRTDQFSLIQSSVHGKLSLSGKERILQCTTCHGAHGVRHVKDPLSPVYSLNIPKTCSNCHSNVTYMRSYNPAVPTDQYQKYITSQHGKLNLKRDPKAADCADCHGYHDIQPPNVPTSKVYKTNLPSTCAQCHSNKEYMQAYNIPTDQFEKYSEGVHGKALLVKKVSGAPSCNDCHGNHAATPPGVESISKVCGLCHTLNAELFANSPHKKAFDKNNYPECEACHGNHMITEASAKLLGTDMNAVCAKCHSESKNVKGFTTANSMRKLTDSLTNSTQEAEQLIKEAEQKGMEVSEAAFKLRNAGQASMEAKTMVHSFDLNKFTELVRAKGLATTKEVIEDAQDKITEYYFRRIGLGISIAIMSSLAVTLFFYIKKIDKKDESDS